MHQLAVGQAPAPPLSVIDSLRHKIRKFETANTVTHAVLPFGVLQIDNHLPEGGLKLGAFHEVTGGGNGAVHGAAAALFAAGILARTSGQILWCIRQRDLFAPALAQVGLNMERVLFVDTGDQKTLLACIEEGLRHGGIAGAVGEIGKLPLVASRRLQLAAESSGAIGIAIRRWRRPADAEGVENTAARTSWRITALPSPLLPVAGISRGRWRVELLRCRGGEPAQFETEACNETGHIAIPAELANRPDQALAG